MWSNFPPKSVVFSLSPEHITSSSRSSGKSCNHRHNIHYCVSRRSLFQQSHTTFFLRFLPFPTPYLVRCLLLQLAFQRAYTYTPKFLRSQTQLQSVTFFPRPSSKVPTIIIIIILHPNQEKQKKKNRVVYVTSFIFQLVPSPPSLAFLHLFFNATMQ